MDPSTTSVIRDIFLIVAAGLVSILCLFLIVVIVKLYRPIRDSVQNSRMATENLSGITADFSKISQETSENLAQTARNLVDITCKAQNGTEELRSAINSVNEAAKSIGSAATTATRVAEMAGRLIPQDTGGGASSGVGALLRFVRSMFGGSRRSDDAGTRQES